MTKINVEDKFTGVALGPGLGRLGSLGRGGDIFYEVQVFFRWVVSWNLGSEVLQ